MKINIKIGDLRKEKVELLVVGLFEDLKDFPTEINRLNEAVKGIIKEVYNSKDFSGKLNQTLLLFTHGTISAPKILLIGLGKRDDFDMDKARQASAKAIREAIKQKIEDVSIVVTETRKVLPSDASQSIVEGAILGGYQFNEYRTENLEDYWEVKNFTVLGYGDMVLAELRSGANIGQVIAESVCFARNLVNHPANVITPTRFAEEAQKLAKTYRFKCQVLNLEDLKKLGMKAMLAVAQGSDQPPKFVVIEHKGNKRKSDTIVIVGKGLTFDSGGISIKPSDGMEKMKYDMAGAAAVLGTLRAVGELKLPVNIVGLMPTTENMPSGKATKPGDVVTSLSGKTIEIVNTDAEGRLVLADALAYAKKYQPKAVIDLATLTGSCIVALGEFAIGLMGNNKDLIEKIKKAGEISKERVWELPLWEEYAEQVKSEIADLKNTGGRSAATITAAYFLSRFAEGYPWVHLDIAGTAWAERNRIYKPYIVPGATGVGIRLLVQFLRDWINKS